MSNEELSPMPTPVTEDPELYPGGVDALPDDPEDNGLGRDLDPDIDPSLDDAVPDEISAPDDKSQAPEGEGDDAEADTTGEDVTDTAKDDRASEPSD